MNKKDTGRQLARLGDDFFFTQGSSNVLSTDSTTTYGFEKVERPNNHPLFESTGKHSRSITLNGEILMPKEQDPLQALYTLAESKKPRPLTIGNTVYGDFIIQSINESRSEFNDNGTMRMLSFSLTLQQVTYT